MANRREFMRTLSGVAALSITTDVSKLGRMRFLRMATAMPDTSPHDRLQPEWYRRKVAPSAGEDERTQAQRAASSGRDQHHLHRGIFPSFDRASLGDANSGVGRSGDVRSRAGTDQVKTWWVKDYEAYFDYPGPVNRVRWIFERVAKRGFDRATHRSGGA